MARRFHVSFYCPDRHLRYDGATPDARGVGGGVTARLRLAAALARRGQSVQVVCNCERAAEIDGVRFAPLDSVRRIEAEVLVLHTTGDGLDLSPVLDLTLDCGQRVVFVDGIDAPKGLHEVGMDRLYACSNFIGGIAQREWGVPADRVFVTHHGVVTRYFEKHWWESDQRSLWRIAYATHPSKGLDAAVEVLRRLRRTESRFELHVFGGNKLWGQPEANAGSEPGVIYHGLLGQRDLAKQLTRCGFALYLQSRPEPFGIAIAEALAAGCITIASAVGAHPEIIEPGATGFLVEGDPDDVAIRRRAAKLIAAVNGNPLFAAGMRRRAQVAPLDWDTVAATWEQLWQGGEVTPLLPHPPCVFCQGSWMLLADGYHCRTCGFYSRSTL